MPLAGYAVVTLHPGQLGDRLAAHWPVFSQPHVARKQLLQHQRIPGSRQGRLTLTTWGGRYFQDMWTTPCQSISGFIRKDPLSTA